MCCSHVFYRIGAKHSCCGARWQKSTSQFLVFITYMPIVGNFPGKRLFVVYKLCSFPSYRNYLSIAYVISIVVLFLEEGWDLFAHKPHYLYWEVVWGAGRFTPSVLLPEFVSKVHITCPCIGTSQQHHIWCCLIVQRKRSMKLHLYVCDTIVSIIPMSNVLRLKPNLNCQAHAAVE